MTIGLGDSPTLYDCENSWNPITGLQCILNGTIVQQIATSVAPPSVLPGIFPVSSANDADNPNVSSTNPDNPVSWLSSLAWIVVIGGVVLIVAKVK